MDVSAWGGLDTKQSQRGLPGIGRYACYLPDCTASVDVCTEYVMPETHYPLPIYKERIKQVYGTCDYPFEPVMT